MIEIKRSSNKNLLHGYRVQLPAYMKAERADHGIFMVILDKDNYDEIKQKLKRVQDEMTEEGEYVPEILYINGMKQPSASKEDYKLPSSVFKE
ncbi:MAG: hypothetical protein Q4B58_07845 [Bacteroidales bacterium]|nr:hypothetical protein [Bacteroidales bacterium]